MARDQATKLRMLAKKKGIKQGSDLLTFSTFMNGEYPNEKASDSSSRTHMIMWGVVVLLSLALLGYAIYDKKNKDEMLSLAGQRAELAGQVQSLAAHVSRLQNDFERNLTRNAQLVTEKNNVDTQNNILQQRLSSAEHEKMLITRQLADITAKSLSSQQQQVRQQTELQKQISDLKAQLDELSRNIHVESGFESAIPVVASASPDAIGSVTLINREYGFIVVSCGKDQGIIRDSRLEIVRNGKVIGIVKVIDSRQVIAAADARSFIGIIAVGDSIRRARL